MCTDAPKDIILFILGGVTYEEAAVVAKLNAKAKEKKTNVEITLGGTHMLKSINFIAGLAQMGSYSDDAESKV